MILPALAVGRAYVYGQRLLAMTTPAPALPRPEPEPVIPRAACMVLGGCLPGPDGDCIYCGKGTP